MKDIFIKLGIISLIILIGCGKNPAVVNLRIINAQKITEKGGISPIWSPDSKKIAFISPAGNIWITSLESGEMQQITDEVVGAGYEYISWSPDGKKFAFNNENDMGIMNIDGTDRVIVVGHSAASQPQWLPKAKRIVFMLASTYAMINIDGTECKYIGGTLGLAYLGYCSGFPPKWAFSLLSNGTQMLINTTELSRGKDQKVKFFPAGIGIVEVKCESADNLNVRMLQKLKGVVSGASCSPDGKFIAFSHLGYIWIMNADGTGLTQLTSSELGNVKAGPVFSPDGKKLAIVLSKIGDSYDNIWILTLGREKD
ncbi:MAG: hypothetical protein AB1422_12985 [bacterium]